MPKDFKYAELLIVNEIRDAQIKDSFSFEATRRHDRRLKAWKMIFDCFNYARTKMKKNINVKISKKLYNAMWEKIEATDFDLRNLYDRDLYNYLGKDKCPILRSKKIK